MIPPFTAMKTTDKLRIHIDFNQIWENVCTEETELMFYIFNVLLQNEM
jgi:hypothetical protein